MAVGVRSVTFHALPSCPRGHKPTGSSLPKQLESAQVDMSCITLTRLWLTLLEVHCTARFDKLQMVMLCATLDVVSNPGGKNGEKTVVRTQYLSHTFLQPYTQHNASKTSCGRPVH